MDRFRSAFNRMIKSERYSRFTLQPADQSESSLDVKMSDGIEVEGPEEGSPSFRPAPLHQNRRNIWYLVLGTLLIFFTGCLIGYISQQKPQAELVKCGNGTEQTTVGTATVAAPTVDPPAVDAQAVDVNLYWNDIAKLLKQKLTSQTFTETLREVDRPWRSAGSEGDNTLGNHIRNQFKELDMDPWSDIHYVQLQMPDSERPNRVIFGSDVFEPVGYLAYSAQGNVQGKLVYGNYGRQEDLDFLHKSNINLNGSVLLLRAGKISFAEQVNNAAMNGAVAVLIYPDVEDYNYQANTPLYGHVHLGSGDPYTPGFPSFNHTQFPPTKSSGLPKIPAQTITASNATTLLKRIGGPEVYPSSGFIGGNKSLVYRLGGSENITVEVNNVLVNKKIYNVFGVIKGFTDPDRYVVLGAQRDAWGKGYAKATVGCSVLIELARAVREMVEKDGFRPRRSLMFASWSAGEYGSVGATEWLEGYMASIDKNVFTYISLDGVVMGRGSFVASASPLLYSLLESTMKGVQNPVGSGTLYDLMGRSQWEAKTMRPMTMDDPAYPFLAFSGIPSISFHFITENTEAYTYYGTNLDSYDHLNYATGHQTSELTVLAAQVAGQMALRLTHDHLIRLDVSRYSKVLTMAVQQSYIRLSKLSKSNQLKGISTKWLLTARSSFQRAADGINTAIANTNLDDVEACRILNNRLMRVEHNLLSPYVSPIETPFRHILVGRGSHTLGSITETNDMEQLHIQLALATWTLQGCANAMVGDIWEI